MRFFKNVVLSVVLCTLLVIMNLSICVLGTTDNEKNSKSSNSNKISVEEELLVTADDEFEVDASPDTFVPSSEWKKIKDGQAIPAGLHIRMNLATGLKEAKLLDGEAQNQKDQSSQSLIHIQKSSDLVEEKFDAGDPINDEKLIGKEKLLRENILEALKNIKSEDNKSIEELELEAKERKKLFRTYKQLKAEFKELNLNIETDLELLKKLLSEYKEVKDEQMRINILEDLDYLVHQVDNAVNFVNMGGLAQIIVPGLNSSNDEIRKGVMRVLGAASQSNIVVQIAALEEGLLSHLLRVIAKEKDATICSRAVYAVSCLVRGFPYGQQRLVTSGGLHALRDLFKRHDWQSFNLKLKVVSLIQDLLQERVEAVGERANQLNEIDLVRSLIDGDWCSAISSLLSAASFDNEDKRLDQGAALGKGISLRPDHDMVDKVVGTMAVLAKQCHTEFAHDLPLLKSLETTYDDLAFKEQFQGEDGHQFFQQVANQIRLLVNQISLNKDEL